MFKCDDGIIGKIGTAKECLFYLIVGEDVKCDGGIIGTTRTKIRLLAYPLIDTRITCDGGIIATFARCLMCCGRSIYV